MPCWATFKMIGKPDLTDDKDDRGAWESRSCGFACEAFCIKWGFFEFSEVVRSPVLDYSDEIFSARPGRSIPKRAAMRYSVLRLMPRISAAFFRLPPVASNTWSR